MKCHSMPEEANSRIIGDSLFLIELWNKSSSVFARLKFVALSEYIVHGLPRRDINRLNADRNEAAVKSPTSSKCIALVLKHMNKQM